MDISTKVESEIELNLTDLALGLLQKAWIIIFCGLLTGTILFSASYYFLEPVYSSFVTLYTSNMSKANEGENLSYADLTASAMIANTSAEILKSELVVNEVIAELGLDYKKEDLLKMISISVPKSTEMIKIEIETNNPLHAAYIADVYAEVASNELTSIIDGSSVKILNHADIPIKPIGPSYLKLLVLGIILGSALAIFVILIQLIFDVRIKTEKDIESFGYPMLGVIPDISTARNRGGYYRA